MSGLSRYVDLEPLLERVGRPLQYVGGELNSQVKDWNCGGEHTVRWALMYPDAYEVGVPNQGVMILYEVLNERADTLAERAYAVWPDLEALLRGHGVPQLSVDGHRALGDFDVLGVSFATELTYTNLLTTLDLSGIPLHADERTDEHPIVLIGGHASARHDRRPLRFKGLSDPTTTMRPGTTLSTVVFSLSSKSMPTVITCRSGTSLVISSASCA